MISSVRTYLLIGFWVLIFLSPTPQILANRNNYNILTSDQKTSLEIYSDITNISCNAINDGSIEITITGGIEPYSFNWSDGSTTANIYGLSQGNYSLTVTDNSTPAIIQVFSFSIIQDIMPELNLGGEIESCEGSLVYLNANNPGCNYLWSTGETLQEIAVSSSNNYHVIVSNTCGTITETVSITFIGELEPIYLGNDTTICVRYPLDLDAGNTGANFIWSTGETAQVISPGQSGTYSVTVTNLCDSETAEIDVIIVSPLLPIYFPEDTIFLCLGEQIILDSGNPSANHEWSTGETTSSIVVESAGTFSYYVYNACNSYRDTIEVIAVFPIPSIDLGNDTTICSTDSIILAPNYVGPDYVWSTGHQSHSINVNQAGTYWVSATNYCNSVYDTINIQVVMPLNDINFGEDSTVCYGSSIVLTTANQGADIMWMSGETVNSITVTDSGTYGVVVSNACGIVGDTVTYQFNHALLPVNLGSDIISCEDPPYILYAGNQEAEYFWSTGETEQSIAVYSSGLYSVTLTNSCGSVTDRVYISFAEPLPEISLGPDLSKCQGERIFLTPGILPGAYFWSTGDTSHQIVVNQYESGVYSLTVTNICGSVVDTIVIHEIDSLILGYNEVCVGDDLEIKCFNDGLYAYSWILPDSSIMYGQTIVIENIDASYNGRFQFVLEDTVLCGCGGFEYTVNIPPELLIEKFDETCILSKDGIIEFQFLSKDIEDSCYIYFNNIFYSLMSNHFSFDFLSPGEYPYLYSEDDICFLRDTIRIFSSESICTDHTLWVPDAFTPNSDGINDILYVFGTGIFYFSMTIYDRWSESIFTYHSIDDGWDGTYNGKLCQNGIYIYELQVFFTNGRNERRTGRINLIR